jgi:hypothetical protein
VHFAYRALTCCGASFQGASAMHQLCNSVLDLVLQPSGPTTPNWQRHQAIAPVRFRLIPFRSPLLGESRLFSSPRGTEMFQFPRFPPLVLCVQTRVTPHDGCGVSPFGHPRIEAWSAAPRGLSQPPTSFIGFRRQGIHRWLFLAWKSKMLVLAMKFSRCDAHHRPEWPAAPPESKARTRPIGAGAHRLLPQNGTEGTGHSVSARPEDKSYDERVARGSE